MKRGSLLSWTWKALGVLVLATVALVAGAAALAGSYHIDWRHIDPKDRLDLAAMAGAPLLYLFLVLFVQRLFLANRIDLLKATADDGEIDVSEPLWAWSVKYLANMSLLVAWLFGTALTEAYLLKIRYELSDVKKYCLIASLGIGLFYAVSLARQVFVRMTRKAGRHRHRD